MSLIDTQFPIFIDYINANTKSGKKEGYKIMSRWAAKKFPFVIIENLDDLESDPIIFYSELGNSINQLISYLNELYRSN